MRTQNALLLAASLLAATHPARAGVFGIFDDLTQLQRHLLSGGPPRDGIPAVTNPEFVDPAQVGYARDDDLVVGVVRNGVAKAYPENLGWWHEIINDGIGGQYISVTLCPLTGTPLVFDATAEDGSQIEFGVSGLLLNSNLVMYDRRDDNTLYPQMIYTGITNPRKGERLRLLPAIETTFAMWKRMYPDSQVALFGTGLERYPQRQASYYADADRFDIYPYGDYRIDDSYFIAPLTTGQPDLTVYAAKEIVTGICIGTSLRAYAFADMAPTAVINDTLGGRELLVAFDLDSRTSIPYSRVVDSRVLRFYQVEPKGPLPVEFVDLETGTRWDLLGQAVEGPLTGARLEPLPAHNAMWFAWSTWWPETTVWDGAGILEAPPVTAVLEPITAAVPAAFVLRQNYPNPFNPSTRIDFDLPADGQIALRIYNSAGQLVRTLAAGPHRAGHYAATWDGADDAGRPAASGPYLCRLEIPEAGLSQARPMTLIR